MSETQSFNPDRQGTDFASKRADRINKWKIFHPGVVLAMGVAACNPSENETTSTCPAPTAETQETTVEVTPEKKAEWGFEISGLTVSSEDLSRLSTIRNRKELKEMDDKIQDAFRMLPPEDLSESTENTEFVRLLKEQSEKLAQNWIGYNNLTSVEKGIALESLYNAYMLDSEADVSALQEAVKKTEVRVEDDRIVAVYKTSAGDDLVLHEWRPDQSPLQPGFDVQHYSLSSTQNAKAVGEPLVDKFNTDIVLSFSNLQDEPDLAKRQEWIKQHIVNETQEELLMADLENK